VTLRDALPDIQICSIESSVGQGVGIGAQRPTQHQADVMAIDQAVEDSANQADTDHYSGTSQAKA
jgi:hypothetical protein